MLLIKIGPVFQYKLKKKSPILG
eukprot:SAG11_NODE_971_length_6351_cov_4.531190_1_plen_22_part_10